MLNRDAILSAQDVNKKYVEIPEWGGGVYVRGMTGKERDDYEASIVSQKGTSTKMNMKNARAKLVVLCTVDEEGNKIFQSGDVLALGNKSSKALDRIFSVAQDLSGISKDDMDDLTGNSEETISESSSFD